MKESKKPLNAEAEFFLRSLDDLDSEHNVGDMSDSDYGTLSNAYTAKAATALRTAPTPGPVGPGRRSYRVWLWVIGCIAVASLAGFLVARSSGQRATGDVGSGAINDSTAGLLARARNMLGTNQLEALKAYSKVLERDPANPEGLTYRGWIRGIVGLSNCSQSALVTDGVKDIELAIASDPTYPDARVFHGNLLRALGRNKEAFAEYTKAKELDTVGAFASLVDPALAETKSAPDTPGECGSGPVAPASSTTGSTTGSTSAPASSTSAP